MKIGLKVQNMSSKICPEGRIDIHFRYISQQYVNIAFFHGNIEPGKEHTCKGPDKKNDHSVTNALVPGYCLIYLIPHNPEIGILDKRGNLIPRPYNNPLAASETFFVRDLKTVYAGWALKISVVALILSSIILAWQILSTVFEM